MIIINNLFLKYIKQYYALYDINLKIKKGEYVAFIGESESGKTSLIRVLTKLEKDYSGEIYIKDIPLKKINYSIDVSLGYVPSNPVFFEKKTVYENFVYVLKLQKEKVQTIENKINNTLIEFNLEGLKNVKIKDLTLYEKFLVSIARLSFRDLEIVIIDEIFDKLNEEEVEKLIEIVQKKLLKKETTLIVTTKNDEIAKKICKRKIYFENGSIVGDKSRK